MGRPTAKQLFRHALDTNDHELAAMLIIAGSFEILDGLQLAEQPIETKKTALATYILNLQPAHARG